MKIGIYPGSFNPVHIGHLAIANYICEFEEFDEVWFLITPQNPVKGKTDMMDQELRLSLVENAIKGYEKFKTCTIEWEVSPPTYTINTLQRLRIRYPQDQFELIIGSDNWETFHRWKDYQMILNNFRVLIYPRKGSSVYSNHPNAYVCKNAPRIDVSASMIRKWLRKGKDIRYFLAEGGYEEVCKSGFFDKKEPIEENQPIEEDM